MAAQFWRHVEPAAFLQGLRSLALGLAAQLEGSATAEERAFVARELELLARELAGGPGLQLAPPEGEGGQLAACEDCVAGVFAQLCLAARAGPPHVARERELLVAACAREGLEGRLVRLGRLAQGAAVLVGRRPLLEEAAERHRPRRPQMAQLCQRLNAVLGAGLLCLLAEAGVTQRSAALLLTVWEPRVGALHQRMAEALARCALFFRQQAREDLEHALAQPAAAAELPARLLRRLQENYDWLRWAVMAWQAEEEPEQEVLAQGNFVAARAPSGLRLVACYAENPSALDKARAQRLIGELEWKLPNPPPDVYASLEAQPARAAGYLARRMLQKLAEGLGPAVTLLVVPGKLASKSAFPPASSLLHEYRHRLAAGTVCLFA